MARGCRPVDHAFYLRNQLWGGGVYQRRGKRNWDALDGLFLDIADHKDQPRPRWLWSVVRNGVDPDIRDWDSNPTRRGHEARTGRSIVERVDTHAGFEGCAAVFRSQLWRLLTTPHLERFDRSTLFAELLATLGWYRAPPGALIDERWAGKHAAFTPQGPDPLLHVRDRLTHPTLDHVALLACAFRMDIDGLLLPSAQVYAEAARHTLDLALKQLGAPSDLASDLALLSEKRLLRNDWGPLDPDSLFSRRRRRGARPVDDDIVATFRRRLNSDLWLRARRGDSALAPIVPLTPELEALIPSSRQAAPA